VFVVGNVPVGVPNGGSSTVVLTATGREAGSANSLGAALVQSTGQDNPMAVDTVFGDAAGATDAARDGAFSSRDQYDIVTATISFLKSARVVSDPVNGTTFPKAVPGAVIEYCLQVVNTGSTAAQSVVIKDNIPANTAYVANSARTNGQVTGTAPNQTCDVSETAAGGVGAGTSFAGNQVTANIAEVPAGEVRTARFSVTVQ
jgi:uncharacterized repeat protein (TIGR01451 family)